MRRKVFLTPKPRSRLPVLSSKRYELSTKQNSVWNSLGDNDRKFYAKIIAGLGLAAGVAFIIWLSNKRVKALQAKLETTKAFGNDKYATWAQQFKQAFDNDGWWGTDVKLVRRTMTSIPSKEDFDGVVKSYKKISEGRNLIMDLSDELTKLEYEEMLAIMRAKPQKSKGAEKVKVYDPKGWARRLHAAVNYTWIGFMPGTDEDAIKTVFREFPNRKAYNETATEYKKMYGTPLYVDLDGDLDWSWSWRALIKKK